MSAALGQAAKRAATQPGFLAGDLHRFASAAHLDQSGVADLLKCDVARFDELALCRTPRRDDHFRSDIHAIASLVDAEAPQLANLVRLVDALDALSVSQRRSSPAPMLAAARGRDERAARPKSVDKRLQPKWLLDAVRLIWGSSTEAPQERFPRDLELAILWRLPLAIIELPNLTGPGVVSWLAERNVDLPVHAAPGTLRGALVAHAGSGVLFVDASDDPAERRMTVAHEAAHFAVDYWFPRRELAQRVPHLLAIVDGAEEPTETDFVDSLLARAPLGVHMHLFERQSGNLPSPQIDTIEQRATQIAWELVAPRDAVIDHVSSSTLFELVRALEGDFGLPRSAARQYAQYLLHVLATRPGKRNFDWE